jgi:CRP-like cAMP-binding protein
LIGDGALHRALNRYTQATIVQIAQSVICNSTHSAEQRACRWLLTTHDRVDRDQFPLTQEFLAQMLGVRRPTVSEIASRLQSEGLIRYTRGVITICDRPGLERITCDCYWIVKAEYDNLLHAE